MSYMGNSLVTLGRLIHLPMQETKVQSLSREDLLEKGMATHSSILTWEIPRTEEPGRLQSMVSPSQTWLSNWTTTTNELHRIQKGKRTLTVLLQEHTACFFEHRHTCSVTQSCLTLCNPTDSSPPGSSYPWNFPGKNTGMGCHFLLQGIFPSQESNPYLLRLLYRQADSLPLAPSEYLCKFKSYKSHLWPLEVLNLIA